MSRLSERQALELLHELEVASTELYVDHLLRGPAAARMRRRDQAADALLVALGHAPLFAVS